MLSICLLCVSYPNPHPHIQYNLQYVQYSSAMMDSCRLLFPPDY